LNLGKSAVHFNAQVQHGIMYNYKHQEFLISKALCTYLIRCVQVGTHLDLYLACAQFEFWWEHLTNSIDSMWFFSVVPGKDWYSNTFRPCLLYILSGSLFSNYQTIWCCGLWSTVSTIKKFKNK